MADKLDDKMLDLTVAHALRLLRNGATVDQALRESAHEHGTSIAAVRRHARRTNVALTPDGKPRKAATFPAPAPEEAIEAAIALVITLVSEGMTQRQALQQAAAQSGFAPRSIARWARQRGQALPVLDPARQSAVANAVLASHVVTVQRQRDLVQILLRVADTLTTHLEAQARRGAANVDGALFGRVVTKLGELHTLDNALMLQVGRHDASLSAEENRRRVEERAGSEVDEYADQWRRDLERFTGEKPPEPPEVPSGTEG